MKKYLYLLVSRDEYELPIAVSESPTEIAKCAGTTPDTVVSSAGKVEKGYIKKSIFRRVPMD